MRSQCPARSASLLLLVAGLSLRVLLAAGQEPTSPPQPQVAPDVRDRLAEAAQDSALAPWQREFIFEVAQGNPARASATQSPAPLGDVLRAKGITFEDGSCHARFRE